MNIEESIILIRDGRETPFVRIQGRLCCIETKPSLLDAGIAALQPCLDNLDEDWGADSLSTATLKADPDQGRLTEREMKDFTSDPAIVALAVKFNQLAEAGNAVEGPL